MLYLEKFRTKRFVDIDDFAKALETVFEGKATILNRMRLSCTFYDKNSEKIGTEDDGQSVSLPKKMEQSH